MKPNFLRRLLTVFTTFFLSNYFFLLVSPSSFVARASAVGDLNEWLLQMSVKFGEQAEISLVNRIYGILFPLGIFLGIISIILAGYSYMTSQGNPERVRDANEKLTSAVVGVFFIVLSLVLLRIIIKSLIDPNF